MDDVEIIDNLVDNYFCEYFIEKLINDGRWKLQKGYGDSPDYGFHFQAFNILNGIDDQRFTPLAGFMLNKFLKESKYHYEKIEIHRVFCNYQNRNSKGIIHKDTFEPKHQSVVFHLNTNDGGTLFGESGEKFIKSESGRCLSFDSMSYHGALGPTEYKQRFVVNIVFAYKKRKLKT